MTYTNAHDEVSRELHGGEKILWSGQPLGGIRLRPSDFFLIPFSILWGGFAIFWETSVVSSGHAPLFFMLWGIPFVCVGLYMIFGRFIYDAAHRKCTYYAVTNDRILIVETLMRRKVTSLALSSLPEMVFEEGFGGTSVIAFGPVSGMMPFRNQSWPGTQKYLPPQFEFLEDARFVYELINTLRRAPQAGCVGFATGE